ncbi:MAG: tetratricopeptide repeat protein, partial [Promethearchaeota archaeon]
GAVMLGVNFPRFDVLWQIRQRFVEGVEPVRQEGREWAKEVVMAIPFIGSLASIGSAIGAIGAKVSPKLKGKYGGLGEWLQTRLGKDYVQRLLEILWKEPRHAEFLYLDALLEDLNNRKRREKPILFLIDQFEDVDSEKAHWNYGGNDITEAELWRIFLTSLSNCVGVLASRHILSSRNYEKLDIEESELTELDRNSCIKLLDECRIKDPQIQDRIASVSGGNPFVICAISDVARSENLTLNELESLRADNLEAVRLKTWRRMFREGPDLLLLVEKAGLLPYFNRRILGIIAPDMRTDHWDRMIRLSFVRGSEDGNWVFHDLARELIVAELGQRLNDITKDCIAKLVKVANEESNDSLLGLAVSIKALVSESDAINLLDDFASLLMWQGKPRRVPDLLKAVRIDSIAGQIEVSIYRAWCLAGMNRVADAEHYFREAEGLLRVHGKEMQVDIYLMGVGGLHALYGWFLERTNRSTEAEEILREGINAIQNYPSEKIINWYGGMTSLYMNLGLVLLSLQNLRGAEHVFQESIKLTNEVIETFDYSAPDGVQWGERTMSWMLAMRGATRLKLGYALEAERSLNEGLELSKDPFSRIIALGNLAEVLRLTDKYEEAQETIEAATRLCKEAYGQDPEMHFFPIAIFLNSLAYVLTRTGKQEEAERIYHEALNVSRLSMRDSQQVFSRYVAWTLNDLGVLLTQFGRYPEAKNAIDESLDLYKQLSTDFPSRFQHLLAWALSNSGVLLSRMDRFSEAEDILKEALDTAKKASNASPEAVFLGDLTGVVLHNLGTLLLRNGNEEDAEEHIQQALIIRRRLADLAPELFLHRLPTTLNNLGVLLAGTKRESEASDVLAEAVACLERLYSLAPSAYSDNLIIALRNQRLLLSNIGEPFEKIAARLNELEFSQKAEDDNWSLVDETQAHPPGFHVAAS